MKIGIVGLGTIGLKLTEYLPQKGFDVVAYNYRAIDAKMAEVTRNFEKKIKYEKLSYEYLDLMLPRISYTSDLGVVADADIVIECSKEDYETKSLLLQRLFELAKPHVVISSTTSSLNLEKLCAAENWNRFCGIHFFNPPTRMRLVELAFMRTTSDGTKTKVLGFLSQLDDKRVIELPPIQGYVVNKLLFQYINSAINLASAEKISLGDVDEAMKLGTNSPMGPFELADYVGLDVTLQILITLFDATGDPTFNPNKDLRALVASGKLGRKTGQGFYTYQK